MTPACVADGSPNSDATTAMRRRLIHARSRISLTTPSVNPSSSVVALQQESGLVTEPNMSPMVPESPGLTLVCPQHPGLAVASRQHIPLVGSISPQPSSVNTVSHCLPADPLVARQCLNSWLLRRWRSRMKRSCAGVVTRGRPDLGASAVEPDCRKRF